MKHLGIKYLILMISLVPVFFIDLFFTYNHISTSIDQANELLQSKGQITARQIAGASEFNLYSGHDSQIQYLLDQSVDTNDIVLASIYDHNGALIAKSTSKHYMPAEASDYLYYRHPILSQSIVHSDVFTPDFADDEIVRVLGWVHLYISRQQLHQTTEQIIIDSITFFIAILLIAIVLTAIISRKITQPIIRLMDHMKTVETGQLGKTIHPIESNEIGAVQIGFNRMTQALLANRQHLNQRIQQATQQLSEAITDLETKNRELGYARDEAQNANKTKSEFLANMSHEIRTPINGIKGFISLLSQSSLNNSQQRYVDIVLKSTNDLTNIINEILDFSKMESGKLDIVNEEFDLHEVIEQTREILFINVLTKNIDLNLIIYSDTPRRVIGDKLRLKQILLNLIGNAIKFTDQGQVVIKVSEEGENAAEAEILISVEDSGIGISELDQQNLFQAFSQVDNSDNRRFTGTGLGLVISKNLATLMGGDISMQSKPDKGSNFDLRLPFKIAEVAEAPSNAPPPVLSTLIFAADKTCLMEIQTLFDRAGFNTESSIIDNDKGISPIRECIQRNLPYIDVIVFDLRHLKIDMDQILVKEFTQKTRVIVMHYDRSINLAANLQTVEFISVISSSQALAKQLSQAFEPVDNINFKSQPRLASQKKTVLLVDDNQVNLKLGSELIRLWGHEVVEAEHGNEAMELYRQQNFDLIILDIQMPDIDGTTLLQMMREHKPEDKTPAVALTANVLNYQAERLLELGFDYFLSKPIDEVRFRAILDGNHQQQKSIEFKFHSDTETKSDKSVDFQRSLALSADNESLLKQIFEILLRDIPDHQQQLMKALQYSEHDKLAAITHKLHGVTCYASLPKLRQMVLAFQRQLTHDTDISFDRAVMELTEELSSVKLEVDQHLRDMKA